MITTYRNNRNAHKLIEVKHTPCGHYMWGQIMRFNNGVTNPVGTPKGGFRRQSKATIDEVLNDYTEVTV